MKQPIIVKAGDEQFKFGPTQVPLSTDCRLVPEKEFQTMIKLLEQSKMLVGNTETGEKESVDVACEIWQDDYNKWNK